MDDIHTTTPAGERLEHLRFLQQMDRVDRSITGSSDLQQMLSNVLETVYSIFQSDRAWLLYPCDPDAPSFHVPMEHNRPEYPGALELNLEVPMAPDLASDLAAALASEGPVVAGGGHRRPVNESTREHFSVESQIYTAIYPKVGAPWCIGMHQCSHARTWTTVERQLFKEIGRRVADGLTGMLILRDLQRHRDQLEQLVEERTAELRRSNRQLKSVNDELESFSYSVSHDLRAPVRIISGMSQLLKKQCSDRLEPRELELVDLIGDNARTMGQLIEDLLTFSRTGRQEMELSEVEVKPMVQRAFDQCLALAPERSVRLEVGELPPVLGDRSLLTQVVVNLVSNAVKFTAHEDDALVQVDSVAGDAGEVVVRVRDNGVGFDPRRVELLFGVFKRLHRADEFEGTGIGLALVQRIIERHGGRVWAEGEPGAGAAFHFSLPAAPK